MLPQCDKLAVPLEEAGMRLARELVPVQAGAQKRLRRLQVRDIIRFPAKGGRLLAAAFADRLRQAVVWMGGEILEGRARTPFFALEKHRDKGRSERQRGGDLQPASIDQLAEPIALRAVADLVVGLGVGEEAVAA